MSGWQEYWYRHCKNCGRCNYVANRDSFISDFFQGKTCSGCGEYAGDWISNETVRVAFLGTWWKPWTWWKFERQSKNRRNENPASPDFESLNWLAPQMTYSPPPSEPEEPTMSETVVSELLPCPFCGDGAFAGTTLDESHYVMCRAENCWAMTGHLPSRASAIAAWNTRTPAPEWPKGWKLVPVIETDAMCEDGLGALRGNLGHSAVILRDPSGFVMVDGIRYTGRGVVEP